jgi:hypothetical protein
MDMQDFPHQPLFSPKEPHSHAVEPSRLNRYPQKAKPP